MNKIRFQLKSKLSLIVFLGMFIEFLGCSLLLIPAYGQTIYFKSNFETSDLSEWTANGSGAVYYAPPLQVTTELTHSGRYSLKCYLADPSVQNNAKVLQWRINKKIAFYSAWYYFDKNYYVTSWGNIMQWKTNPSGTLSPTSIEPTFFLMASTGQNNIRHLLLYHWPVGLGYLPPDPPSPGQTSPGNYHQSNPIPIPDSTWVHIEVYYKTDRVNGQVTVWQDGVRVFDVNNVNTQDSIEPSEFVMFGVGNYISPSERKNQLLYIDDIMVTDYQVSATRVAAPNNIRIVP